MPEEMLKTFACIATRNSLKTKEEDTNVVIDVTNKTYCQNGKCYAKMHKDDTKTAPYHHEKP